MRINPLESVSAAAEHVPGEGVVVTFTEHYRQSSGPVTVAQDWNAHGFWTLTRMADGVRLRVHEDDFASAFGPKAFSLFASASGTQRMNSIMELAHVVFQQFDDGNAMRAELLPVQPS
jgi:hypothetical protein